MSIKGPTEKARLDADRKAEPKTKIVAILSVPNGATVQSDTVRQYGSVKLIGLYYTEKPAD